MFIGFIPSPGYLPKPPKGGLSKGIAGSLTRKVFRGALGLFGGIILDTVFSPTGTISSEDERRGIELYSPGGAIGGTGAEPPWEGGMCDNVVYQVTATATVVQQWFTTPPGSIVNGFVNFSLRGVLCQQHQLILVVLLRLLIVQGNLLPMSPLALVPGQRLALLVML